MSANRILEHWDDERAIGNSLIVTLITGWRFTEDGEHVRGFDTKKEATTAVRKAVKCGCRVCLSASAAHLAETPPEVIPPIAGLRGQP